MKEYIVPVDESTLEQDKLEWFKEQGAKELVRCKDCKHRPVKPDDYETGFDLEFPDGKCPCQGDDGYYSWYPNDNWFCANGEIAK